MDKDKHLNHGGGLRPPSGRYSVFPSHGSSSNVKPEPLGSTSLPLLGPESMSDSVHFGHTISSISSGFSHDISRMPDNPPKNLGHRRAHSEILTLPDDISFDSDLGVFGGMDGPSFSYETEEDLLSMYLDIDKFNSSSATFTFQMGKSSSIPPGSSPTSASAVATPVAENAAFATNEKSRVRHQHSQSMDGSTSIKQEMLISGVEEPSSVDFKKAMSASKLAELALVDPKRAKRIWANRQSAARSKERKMRYITELERKVQTLQTEATSLSAQLTLLQRDTNGLTVENSELKLRLQTTEQEVHLQDELNGALKEEIQHLKILTGQTIQNGGGSMMNFPSSFGANQQFYPNNHSMQTLLTAQQFRQLQIQSQKQQQQQFQHHQLQQFQQQQLKHQKAESWSQQIADLKMKGSIFSSQKENISDISASSSSKD